MLVQLQYGTCKIIFRSINDHSFSRILKGTHGSPAYPNERIADYKGKLKRGDVLVHDSSIGIYDPIGGTPAILTAREGQPINGKKQYTDLLVSSGYEWKRDVLAVVRAKVQMARCRTMPNDLH